MPVRSSLCTSYSPSSMSTATASTGKYSSILPSSSSLSYGQYKPLSSSSGSNSSSFRSGKAATSASSSISSPSSGISTLGRYSRLTTTTGNSPTVLSASSTSYSPVSSYSSTSPSSSTTTGHYKPYNSSSFSSRYGNHLTTSSSTSSSPRYSTSSSTSSTGSLTSNTSTSSSSGDHSYHSSYHKSPGTGAGSSLTSSAYSSGSSLSSSSYTSPYSTSSRASRRLSSSAVSPPLPPGVPCGLVNLGNTCYMNASLQALYSLESFRNLILGRHHHAASASDSSHDKVLTSELCEVFKQLKSSASGTESSAAPISPANFKYAFSRHQTKFSGYGQQDAQEFLRYLINGIHEESNAATKRPRRTRPLQAPKTAQEAWLQYRDIVDDSPLVDLLVGQLCSTITCSECGHKSNCWDPFWDLSLPLMTRGSSGGSTYSWRNTSQLSDVIDEFTSKEVLDSDERPICSHCKKATRSTKQISLARLPRFMILHLKKFTNDGYKLTSGEIQINKQLSFNGTTYYLKACISHHGHSSSSGHYTSHCEYASRWYHFDDGRVRDVSTTFDSTKLDDAYVLFYTQTAASSSSLSQSKL